MIEDDSLIMAFNPSLEIPLYYTEVSMSHRKK